MSYPMLSDMPVGIRLRLTGIHGGRLLTRRLLALGLTLGCELQVLQVRGRAVVVGKQGNRVALGKAVAEQLQTEVVA